MDTRIEHSIAELPTELDFSKMDGWPMNWSYARIQPGEWQIYRTEEDEQGNTISHVYPLPFTIGSILEHRSNWARNETRGSIQQTIKAALSL